MSSKYSIKDLELMSGIKAHTLRIWELRYKILKPQRTTTNIRYYSDADLRKILNISILNRNGHKISNIAALNDKELVDLVERYLNDYLKESNKIESLYIALLDLQEEKVEEIINNASRSLGFENTVEKIIFPFLRHLGNMWQVGAISPAQEHYISNLIRQKLITGLDQLVPEVQPHPKTYLFFLPEHELHELGLLYTCYLAKSKGHRCVYLGQSVPLEDLITITRSVKPHYMVGIFTNRIPDDELAEFLKTCERDFAEPLFLLSGKMFLDGHESIRLPSGKFTVFADFPDFKKWL